MELCGFYSQWKLPTAFKSQEERLQNPETRSCTFGVPEAMHASQSQGYASRLASRYGAARAQAAARWLADGSASPMETAVYLLLCLPKRLGGYGLPRPVLNPSVTIQTPDGNLERHPDLYWEERNIDVEYNSDEDHSGEWARYRDSKREVQLATADVRTLPLTRDQLMSAEGFDEFAWILRRLLGIRARKPDANWYARRSALRERLLHSWKDA